MTLEAIRKAAKNGMFAERVSTTDALLYAHELADAEGCPRGVMTIAIMVYHNTLVDTLINIIKETVGEPNGTQIKSDE